MSKKIISTLVVLLFTTVTFAVAFASDATDGPDGNKRKGKYTYRKVYKACSETGEVESATPTVSPANKKRAEWKEIFETKNFAEFGCQDFWSKLTEKDIVDIYSYFYGYAADSPTPATCK